MRANGSSCFKRLVTCVSRRLYLPALCCTALFAADAHSVAQQPVEVPLAMHEVMIDGRLGPREWSDATQFKLGDKAIIKVKRNEEYVWIAVEYLAGEDFIVDLYLQTGDGALYDLHSSAKLGERKLAGKTWPEPWTWWNNDGWVANCSRVDSFEQRTFLPQKVREFQISRERFGGKSWRIYFELMSPGKPDWQRFTYPDGAKNTSVDKWITLRFMP